MRPIRTSAVLAAAVLAVTACNAEKPAASGPSQQPSPSATFSSPTVQARLNEQLIKAAWDNDLRRARALIAEGADVNAKDNTVQSAYLISTSEGYLQLLDLTLKHRADVDSKDSFNGTGLIRAADRGHADIAGRLVQADIKINHINNLGWTALHEAIILGDGSRRYVDTVPARSDQPLAARNIQGPRRDRQGSAYGAGRRQTVEATGREAAARGRGTR
jgi:ankyrin repeat protein